ncbi:MAG: HNH endonuclease, partial [Thermoplasmata archaeon]|nr:HNH endonuclease [Thermoplasmata archaeon]
MPFNWDFVYLSIKIERNFMLLCQGCDEVIDLQSDFLIGHQGTPCCNIDCYERFLKTTSLCDATNHSGNHRHWHWIQRYVFKRDEYQCFICGTVFQKERLSMHHKIPLRDKGLTIPSNLITC